MKQPQLRSRGPLTEIKQPISDPLYQAANWASDRKKVNTQAGKSLSPRPYSSPVLPVPVRLKMSIIQQAHPLHRLGCLCHSRLDLYNALRKNREFIQISDFLWQYLLFLSVSRGWIRERLSEHFCNLSFSAGCRSEIISNSHFLIFSTKHIFLCRAIKQDIMNIRYGNNYEN